jgi:hypothetical protein
MIRQMFWRSGAVHRGRPAPSALGKTRWSMIGALAVVGFTGYLLLSFADERHARGGPSLEVADTPIAPNKADASNHARLDLSPPLMEKWQNLPLLALRGSPEIAAEGEVRILALQAAFERERNSAAAAQLQVIALQEQVDHLRERQEEVLVLREQLADTEAHSPQVTEPASEEIEQKKRADHALLRVAALQEELASLGKEVLRAKTTAEGEKARADSALMQLDDAQHQLTAVTALQGDRTEIESRPQQANHNQILDSSPLNNSESPLPAERVLKLPVPPKTTTVSPVEQRQIPSRNGRLDKREKGAIANPRQALLSIESGPPSTAVNKTAPVPARRSEPDTSRLKRARQEPKDQSVHSAGKPPQGTGPQSRLLAHDTQKLRTPGTLSLPSALLPDSALW